MKISDILYFAPGIRFDEVDIDGPRLPDQFRDRVDGFYVAPAKECAQSGRSFAAGTLLVSCIDALARLRYGGRVGDRFVTFARQELQSFSIDSLAKRFYEEFRNGLVHQGTLKKGGQFSLDTGNTLTQFDGILIVNPQHLAEEVSSALDSYVKLLQTNDAERKKLAESLRRDLREDFRVAGV